MSGIVSAGPDPTILQNALSGRGLIQTQAAQQDLNQNALLYPLQVQSAQQRVALTDMDVLGRAAGTLYNMEEPQAAAAYPAFKQAIQAQGFGKNLPDAYPGHAAVANWVQRTMPVADQMQYGFIPMPGMSGAPPLPGQPGYGGYGAGTGGTTGGGGPDPVAAMPREQALDAIAKRESANQNVPNAQGGDASGYWQIRNATWQDGAKLAGIDVSKWPRAMDAPWMVQRAVAGALFDKYGARPWAASAPGGATVAAQPPGGVAARTGGVNVAGPPGTVPAAPGGAPGGAAPVNGKMTDEEWLANQAKTYPGLAGPNYNQTAPAPGADTPPAPQLVPGAPGPGPRAAPPPGAPGAAAVPPPAPNGPGPQPPAPAPPAGGAAAQPPAAPPPATGTASQKYQQAQQMIDDAARNETLAAQYNAWAKLPGPRGMQYAQAAAQFAAEATRLKAQASLLMGTDSWVQRPDGTWVNVLTNEPKDPAKPLADYHETSPGSGVWVGGPGTEPRFQPPGRLVVDPAGNVWQTSVGGAHMLAPTDPAALAARKAAEASGTALGTATGKLPGELADQGRNATQAIANIDYGLNQLQQAAKGGIPTGYFSDALGTAAAMAKSLGIDTSSLGVDPKSVGNIQSAQKTLAVVSAAILQQMLGSGQITDAKVAHFIHAQPGIEMDPNAVSRVLNWARSQFVYEREMAAQGMKDASATGMLPTNWEANYYDKHGFAPIYNPGTGEMQQPDGGAPGREPPPDTSIKTAPVNPSARTAGTTYQTPKGPMKWTGTGWVPVQ